MARQLFGTDGIRGVAGEPPLDDPTVYAAGRALGELVRRIDPHPEVLIGMDTRESGRRLAELVAGGLERTGVPARFAGVLPTPGLAYLTHCGPFFAGVMISASHNPYRDNGIKVFAHSGFKLPDEQEEQVEEGIRRLEGETVSSRMLQADPSMPQQYINHLVSSGGAIEGAGLAAVVVDCANGAACAVASRLFERLGVTAEIIADRPNGRNINLECGSMHLDALRRRVLETGAGLGVAFDGDADRALFVTASGREVNGDAVLWMAARHFGVKQVISTTMANLGLEKALAARGVSLVRTPVGDKYVLEEMVRRDAELGGEQSGHVIFRRWATTGDGLLTALKVLEIMAASGRSLDALVEDLPVYPQVIRNVAVKARTPLEEAPEVAGAIRAAQAALAGRGRVIVRYSGTEPLIRVMVEADTADQVERHAGALVAVITERLGA